jgi:ribosomal protein S18 acetylase RimI-like enzyme
MHSIFHFHRPSDRSNYYDVYYVTAVVSLPTCSQWAPPIHAQTTCKKMSVRLEALTEASEEEISRLVEMINEAYDKSEHGMWKVEGFRTDRKEVEDLVTSGRLLVAKGGPPGGESICGCVKIDQIDDSTGGLGMLVVDSQSQGQGLGRKLVEAAEERAQRQGHRQMQLEVLAPKTWKHPSKEISKAWYARMGYAPQSTRCFEEDHPKVIPILATKCDFTIWKKTLDVL